LLDSGPAMIHPTLKGHAPIQDDPVQTMPRQFPPPSQQMPRPQQPMQPMQQPMQPMQRPMQQPIPPQRRPHREGQRRTASKRKSPIRPWMVIVAVIAIALIITMIVALSGPNVPSKGTEPTPTPPTSK